MLDKRNTKNAFQKFFTSDWKKFYENKTRVKKSLNLLQSIAIIIKWIQQNAKKIMNNKQHILNLADSGENPKP